MYINPSPACRSLLPSVVSFILLYTSPLPHPIHSQPNIPNLQKKLVSSHSLNVRIMWHVIWCWRQNRRTRRKHHLLRKFSRGTVIANYSLRSSNGWRCDGKPEAQKPAAGEARQSVRSDFCKPNLSLWWLRMIFSRDMGTNDLLRSQLMKFNLNMLGHNWSQTLFRSQ